MRAAGIENCASLAAMRMSQLMATLMPPPMHQPRMQASVGLALRAMLLSASSARASYCATAAFANVAASTATAPASVGRAARARSHSATCGDTPDSARL